MCWNYVIGKFKCTPSHGWQQYNTSFLQLSLFWLFFTIIPYKKTFFSLSILHICKENCLILYCFPFLWVLRWWRRSTGTKQIALQKVIWKMWWIWNALKIKKCRSIRWHLYHMPRYHAEDPQSSLLAAVFIVSFPLFFFPFSLSVHIHKNKKLNHVIQGLNSSLTQSDSSYCLLFGWRQMQSEKSAYSWMCIADAVNQDAWMFLFVGPQYLKYGYILIDHNEWCRLYTGSHQVGMCQCLPSGQVN